MKTAKPDTPPRFAIGRRKTKRPKRKWVFIKAGASVPINWRRWRRLCDHMKKPGSSGDETGGGRLPEEDFGRGRLVMSSGGGSNSGRGSGFQRNLNATME